MPLIVLGSVFVDIKGYPLDSFIMDGRNAGRIEVVHGGVSRNIAENIGNIGLPCAFVSLVDKTAAGAEVLSRLKEHGVDVKYVRRTDTGMGTWLAVFDNNRDVAASVSQRPDLLPIADILDEKGDEIFQKARAVLLELDMDAVIVKKIYALAKKYGKSVYAAVANMSLALENRMFLKDTACFVCNRQEAGMLFAEDYEGKTPEDVTEDLRKKVEEAGLQALVVTLGRDGAVYVDGSAGVYGITPAGKVPVADTTGAGDAFFSGTAAGLAYGKTLADACEIGNRLASSVIRTPYNTCPRFSPAEFGLDF